MTAVGSGSAGGAAGASMSRRSHRRGDGCVMDFCSPSSAASCRCHLQHRWGGGGRYAGATAVGLLGLAVAWMVSWLVLVLRMAEGESGESPRRRRLERPVSEEEDEPGAGPRPARHSERWASWCSFWWFTKLISAMGLLLPRVRRFLLVSLLVLVAGGEWRMRAGVAELVRGLGCFLTVLWGCFCNLYESTVLLDLSLSHVRVLYSVCTCT